MPDEKARYLSWKVFLFFSASLISGACLLSLWTYRESRGVLIYEKEIYQLEKRQKDIDSADRRMAQLQDRTQAQEEDLQAALESSSKRLKLAQREFDKQKPSALSQNQTSLRIQIDNLQQEIPQGAKNDDIQRLAGNLSAVEKDVGETQRNSQISRSEVQQKLASMADKFDALSNSLRRDIHEFVLEGLGETTTVSNVEIKLVNTKPQSGQFTIRTTFDNNPIEKKDWYKNEPFYLYQAGTLAVVEIVVQEVGTNKLKGYVNAPSSVASKQ